MTDTEKLHLIYRITCDFMEFVDYDKSSMDALTTCIATIHDFKPQEEA